MVTTGTVSERSAWIRRGWEDQHKGWPRRLEDVPAEWREAYALGRRRARDAERKQG